MNISCVICSDSLISSDTVFTTPCGHIFHHVCLERWMERKKDCPQCRSKCTQRSIFRIYFNNISNLDVSQTSSTNLIETVDNLTFQVREKDLTIKKINDEKIKLKDSIDAKDKKIKKLDAQLAQSNQIVATMKHEIDLMSTHRATYKVLETENAEMKAKLGLLQTVETVLSASQREIDDILKQNLNNHDLSVMVATLRRELNNNELRKNELRKQNQILKNDLRIEQEEKKSVMEKNSFLESENHRLINKLKRIESANADTDLIESTPEPVKKKLRVALNSLDEQNTPSPLSRSDLEGRIKQIQESDSPYFKLKSSSLAMSSILKKPLLPIKQTSKPSEILPKLSIFQKPRAIDNKYGIKKTDMVFDGMGSSSKVLQSDLLVEKTSLTIPTISHKPKLPFKKNLSASALNK